MCCANAVPAHEREPDGYYYWYEHQDCEEYRRGSHKPYGPPHNAWSAEGQPRYHWPAFFFGVFLFAVRRLGALRLGARQSALASRCCPGAHGGAPGLRSLRLWDVTQRLFVLCQHAV